MIIKILLFFIWAHAIASEAHGLAGPKSDLPSCKLERKKIYTTEPKTEGFTYKSSDKGSPSDEGDDLICENEDSDSEDANLKPQHKVCKLHETCEPKPNQGVEHDTIIRAQGSKYDDTAFSEALRECYRSSEIKETKNPTNVDSDKNAMPRATWEEHNKKDNDDNDITGEDIGEGIEEEVEDDDCPSFFSDCGVCGSKHKMGKIIACVILGFAFLSIEAFFLWLNTIIRAVEHHRILERKWQCKVIVVDRKQITPKVKVISKKLTKLYKRVLKLNKVVEALAVAE